MENEKRLDHNPVRTEQLRVPGLGAIAARLRSAYPDLSEQAIERILRLPNGTLGNWRARKE